MTEQKNKLVEYIGIIFKWRHLFFWNILIVSIVALIISLLVPKKYTAKAILLPPEQGGSMGMLSSLTGMNIPGMDLLGGGDTSPELFKAILDSRTISEIIIKRFNLLEEYKLKKNYDENPAMGMELAVEELRTNFGAVVNEDDLLILRFTSKNPEKAAEITNAYIEELDHFNKEMNITNAKRNRIFLEERVHQVQLDLSAAEDSLRSFQETHKIIALEEEIAMAIQSYAELKAQLIESEIQLGILQQHSTHNNPQIALLKNQIRELEKQLKQMQTATDSTSIGKNELGFTIPFDDVPEVGLELIRLTREMEIQNRVYAFLLEQYEQAKIQEAKDTPTVQILDYAVPPGKKSWPPRTLIILTSALIAAILSLVLVLLLEFWQDIQSQDKYKELRKLLEIIKKDLSWLPFIK